MSNSGIKASEVDENSAKIFDKVTALILDHEFEDARDVLLEILDSGNNDAYLYLGKVHELEPSKNPILNYEKAYNYYCRAADSTQALDAYISIAYFLSEGLFVAKDIENAMSIYLELLNQGHHKFGFLYWKVGCLHLNAVGVIPNLDVACDYLSKGWAEKHVPSLYWLGVTEFRRKKYLGGISMCVRAFFIWVPIAIFNRNSHRIAVEG